MSPFTPPPPRHHLKLPWQRHRSMSPCNQRVRKHADSSKSSSSVTSATKSSATRAMQTLLIYPEAMKPRRAFASSSTYERLNECAEEAHSGKKQVRFANTIQFQSENLPKATLLPKKVVLCQSASYASSGSSDASDPILDDNEEVTSAHRSILRKNTTSRVPSLCDSDTGSCHLAKDPLNHPVFPVPYQSGQRALFSDSRLIQSVM